MEADSDGPNGQRQRMLRTRLQTVTERPKRARMSRLESRVGPKRALGGPSPATSALKDGDSGLSGRLGLIRRRALDLEVGSRSLPSELAHQLAGILAKLDFADECMDTLDDEWHGHLKAIRIVFDYDPQTGWHTAAIAGIHDVPRLCVLAGASLNQARSALDHMVWVLVKRNHKKATSDHSFPIFLTGNKESFMRGMRRPARGGGRHGELYGVRRSAVALIEQFQPYNSRQGPEATALLALHRLAKKDRHRTLTETLTWMARDAVRPLFTAPDECEIAGYRNLLRDPQLNLVREGTKLACIRMKPAMREPKMQVDGDVPVNIGFGEGTAFQSIQALKDINRSTRTIIDVLDTFGSFGASRRKVPGWPEAPATG
jgi:hypothetical protein